MWGCLPLRTALFRLASLDLFRVQGSDSLIQVQSAGRADAFLYCLPATCRLPGLFFAPSPACFVVVASNLGNLPVTGAFLCPFSCLFCCCNVQLGTLQKGDVPAAPSGTATLLRLSPNHRSYPRPAFYTRLQALPAFMA